MSRPDWSRHAPKLPEGPCAIEQFSGELGIERGEWERSQEMREWCRRWRGSKFIPESVLDAFGMKES